MVGLSVGGHIAYAIAAELPLASLALFYPGWLNEAGIGLSRPEPLLDLTPAIAAHGTSVLFLIGADDALYTPAALGEITGRMAAELPDPEIVVYPDTPHGFFCDTRESYRRAAAEDAFARVSALLG